MSSKQPSGLLKPKSDDQSIWRYLSYPKLLSLLNSAELRFTRADNFADPLEGYLPLKTMLNWVDQAQQKNQETAKAWDWGDEIDLVEGLMEKSPLEVIQHQRKLAFVSCWNADVNEKEKLWKQYTPDGKGVVIKSTVGRLKRAIQDIKLEHLSIGEVQYLDFEESTHPFHRNFTRLPFAYKDKTYEDEKEIRAIVFEEGFNQENFDLLKNQGLINNEDEYLDYRRDASPVRFDQSINYQNEAVTTDVDLEELIKEIRISPFGKGWQQGVLEGVISHKFELDIDVIESSLDMDTRSDKPSVDTVPDRLYSGIKNEKFITLDDLINLEYDFE